MFLGILEFIVKNKKKLGKLFWKCGLSFKKIDYVSIKLLLEKSAKTKKKKNAKPGKRLKSLADFGDKTSSSCKFLRPHFENSFSQTIFFVFHSKVKIVLKYV